MNFNTIVQYEKSLIIQAFFYVYLFKNEIKMKFLKILKIVVTMQKHIKIQFE